MLSVATALKAETWYPNNDSSLSESILLDIAYYQVETTSKHTHTYTEKNFAVNPVWKGVDRGRWARIPGAWNCKSASYFRRMLPAPGETMPSRIGLCFLASGLPTDLKPTPTYREIPTPPPPSSRLSPRVSRVFPVWEAIGVTLHTQVCVWKLAVLLWKKYIPRLGDRWRFAK